MTISGHRLEPGGFTHLAQPGQQQDGKVGADRRKVDSRDRWSMLSANLGLCPRLADKGGRNVVLLGCNQVLAGCPARKSISLSGIEVFPRINSHSPATKSASRRKYWRPCTILWLPLHTMCRPCTVNHLPSVETGLPTG